MKPKFKILFSDVGEVIALFRRKEYAVRVYGGSWSGVRVGIVVGEQLSWKVLETVLSHLKELQVKGNLLDCSQILTVASFTYKQQKSVSEFVISKYFFFKSDFCMITPHFFNPISQMFCNFSLKLNMANRRHVFFGPLAPETEEHIK